MTTETETRTVLRIDDLTIDEESGEILDWPAGVVDKIRYLQEQQILGGKLEKEGLAIKHVAGRALLLEMDRVGERKLRTENGPTSTWYQGRTIRKAPRAKVDAAVEQELITESYAETLILSAAKELDPDKLEDGLVFVREEAMRNALRAFLIEESESAGHVRTTEAKVKPPRVTREEMQA